MRRIGHNRLQLVVLAALIGAPAVWAAIRQVREHESQALLHAAATAHQRVSYAGSVLWNGRFKGKTFGVRHDAQSGRTAYTMGAWREWTMSRPSSRMPDPAAWCAAPKVVGRNYRAKEIGFDEFLGRKVRVLRLRPRHRGRPSLDLYVDAQTDLPLKVTTYRPDGSLYRVAKFESVEFGEQIVEERNLHNVHKFIGTPVPLEDPQDSAGFRPLLPDYLPDGFRLVEARVKQRATPRLVLLYSDGGTAFELSQAPFATPAAIEAHYRKFMSEGRVRRMMDWRMMKARKRLVEAESGPGAKGKVTCRHRRGRSHSTHELRVDDIDVKLTARSDIDRGQMLDVLRSLRRR